MAPVSAEAWVMLSPTTGRTRIAPTAPLTNQCLTVGRPYLVSSTVTACAASTSSDSSFR